MDSLSPNQHQPIEEKQSPSPMTPRESQGESRSRSPSVEGVPMAEQAIVPYQGAPDPHPDQEAVGQAEGNLHLALGREDDKEYGCKFCEKKFSNKQALGGHQNAHKVERTVEKSTRDMHENPFGYFSAAGQSSSSNPNLLNLMNSNNQLLNRAFISWNQPPVQQQQQQQFFGPRPVMQMGEAYGTRPVFNLYQQQPNWNQGGPSAAPARVPIIVTNPAYLNQQGGGYLGLGLGPIRPVFDFQAGAGYPGPLRIGSERTSPGINLRNVPGDDVDESGLDLSLHL